MSVKRVPVLFLCYYSFILFVVDYRPRQVFFDITVKVGLSFPYVVKVTRDGLSKLLVPFRN